MIQKVMNFRSTIPSFTRGELLRFCSLVVGFLDHVLEQSWLMIYSKCFLAHLALHTMYERDIGHSLGRLER